MQRTVYNPQKGRLKADVSRADIKYNRKKSREIEKMAIN